jgi:branched-chain amino acid transport system permease protein
MEMDIFWQLFLQGLVLSIVYLLIASGFGVIYGTTSHFHISHAGVFTLAGYFLYVLSEILNLPLVIAFVLALILCAGAGILIYSGLYRPILNKGGTPLVLFIASLGLLTVIDNIVITIFSPDPQNFSTTYIYQTIEIFGASITIVQLLMIILGVILLGCLYYFMNKTRMGRMIKATSVNPSLSQIVGISIKKIHIICYGIGSLLVAIPGFYYALDAGANSGRGIELVIIATMSVIMGGIRSLVGGWIAALFIGMFYNISILWIPAHWQTAFIFAIFLVIIMVRPMGLLGKKA